MADILIQKCVKNGWIADEPAEMIDDENEHTVWTEWRLDGLIVKRGAHVRLKRNIVLEGIASMLR